MTRVLAWPLAAILFAGILTCWAPGLWPVALLEIGAFVLAAVWIVRTLLTGAPVHLSPVFAPLAGAALWGALQLVRASTVYPYETANSVLSWCANLTVFALALQACSDTPTRNRFLRAILWFGFCVSVLAVLQYFTSEGKVFWLFPSPYTRTMGPFLYKNQFAAFIELVFPLALYQSLADRRQPLLYAGMAATMFAAVIAAVSRAGVALVIGELAAILLLAWRRGLLPGRAVGRTLVQVAALCAALTAVVGWQVTLEKFREPEPYRVRRELLLSSLDMAREHPWMGFGLGAWPVVYPAYARFDNGLTANRAHNDWAEWAAEGGLPFVAMIAMIALWSAPRAARLLWPLGIPAVFAGSLVDYPLREPALAALLFAMLGALAARDRSQPRCI